MSKKMQDVLKRIVSDFEGDFVLDGEIVDNPEERYHLLPEWYRLAKKVLAQGLNADSYSKDDLKPCPFCGGEAEIRPAQKGGLRVGCKNTMCFIGIEQKTLRYGLDWLKVKLIERWNTRAEATK